MIKKIVLFFSYIMICASNLGFASSIKAVVFDFGGVVATVDRTQLLNFLSQSLQISPKALPSLIEEWKVWLNDGGEEKQFWKDYAYAKNLTLPPDWDAQFDQAKEFAFKPLPQTLAIVQRLKKRGYQTVLFSNVTAYHAKSVRQLGYYDLFDTVILSYEIGVAKPDPQAYQILLEKLSLPASALIFIDDREENIAAAESMGISSILFTTAENLQAELKKKGVL